MAKRRKSSPHRPPPWYVASPVVLTEAYQREVDQSGARLAQAYAKAQRRAVRARERLTRAENASKSTHRLIVELRAQLEIRLAELADYERMMTTSPASATHRGTKSYRKIPQS